MATLIRHLPAKLVKTLFWTRCKIKEKLYRQLDTNGCDFVKLGELCTILVHAEEFLKKLSRNKAWRVLFKKKRSLGIENILRIVCPLGNAEVERIFSLLWRIFCQGHSSLSNKVQEDLLRLRGSIVTKDVEDYADAMDLKEYPDGKVRKRSRRLDGHVYPLGNRKSKKKSRTDMFQTINDLVSSSSEESDKI